MIKFFVENYAQNVAGKLFPYQARRTLFKTGTASVASKKTEMGVWGAL